MVIMHKKILIAILLLASFSRLYKLNVNPPSMFGDEADVGYHAYSILKTGRDYQGNLMPLHFHSLAEWRTPLYLYASVPTVAIFGVSPLGVRLPAAVFGVLSIYAFYLLIKQLTKNETLSLISATVLSISPWHLHYSRAGFEVTMLLYFLIFGLFLFFKSLLQPKQLWLSGVILVSTPLIYSTAKFFTPFLLVILLILYRKELFKFPNRYRLKAILSVLIIGGLVTYATLFSGGTQRFNYISIFSDPVIVPEIGNARQIEARVRGEKGEGLTPNLSDRIFNNKFTYVGNVFIKNYLQSFSTEFLFTKGDPNPRQSTGFGQFYRIEFVFLILGIVFFFKNRNIDSKFKILSLAWLILAPIPAALTRDGGNHATRLILMLPILMFLISYGVYKSYQRLNSKYKPAFVFAVFALYILHSTFYIHDYYTFYPWRSERWWHYGWTPAIKEIKNIDKDYEKVIISMSGEPAWIFFAANYQYDPKLWQKEYPIGNDVEVAGFGKISHTGKFYFGSPDKSIQIYGLGKVIDSKTLYLANASEVGANLILEPNRVPEGLKLIKAIAFPSGEPSMYLFAGIK